MMMMKQKYTNIAKADITSNCSRNKITLIIIKFSSRNGRAVSLVSRHGVYYLLWKQETDRLLPKCQLVTRMLYILYLVSSRQVIRWWHDSILVSSRYVISARIVSSRRVISSRIDSRRQVVSSCVIIVALLERTCSVDAGVDDYV